MPKQKRLSAFGRKVSKRPKITAGKIMDAVLSPPVLYRTGGRAPFSRAELKNIDTANPIPGFIFGSGGFAASSPILLNGVATGSSATNRIGRRIVMKSLLIRYNVTLASTTTNSTPLRIVIVYDKQANTTAPSATDVFQTTAFSSPMNLANSRRFRVLYDKMHSCIGDQGPESVAGEKYIKLNLPVEFNTGSAGTIGDITSGSVYCFSASDGTLGVASPSTQGYCRIRFTDN